MEEEDETNSWGVGAVGDTNFLRVNDIYVAATKYGVGGDWSTHGSSADGGGDNFYNQRNWWTKKLRASEEVVFGKAVFNTVESGSTVSTALYYFKLAFDDTAGAENDEACSTGSELADYVATWYNSFMDAVVDDNSGSYQVGKYLVLDLQLNPGNDNKC